MTFLPAFENLSRILQSFTSVRKIWLVYGKVLLLWTLHVSQICSGEVVRNARCWVTHVFALRATYVTDVEWNWTHYSRGTNPRWGVSFIQNSVWGWVKHLARSTSTIVEQFSCNQRQTPLTFSISAICTHHRAWLWRRKIPADACGRLQKLSVKALSTGEIALILSQHTAAETLQVCPDRSLIIERKLIFDLFLACNDSLERTKWIGRSEPQWTGHRVLRILTHRLQNATRLVRLTWAERSLVCQWRSSHGRVAQSLWIPVLPSRWR